MLEETKLTETPYTEVEFKDVLNGQLFSIWEGVRLASYQKKTTNQWLGGTGLETFYRTTREFYATDKVLIIKQSKFVPTS